MHRSGGSNKLHLIKSPPAHTTSTQSHSTQSQPTQSHPTQSHSTQSHPTQSAHTQPHQHNNKVEREDDQESSSGSFSLNNKESTTPVICTVCCQYAQHAQGHAASQHPQQGGTSGPSRAIISHVDAPCVTRIDDRKTDDLFRALKMIANLKEDQKLGTNQGQIKVFFNTRTTFLERWWLGERRQENINTLQTIIDEFFELVNHHLELRDEILARNRKQGGAPDRKMVVEELKNKQFLERAQKSITGAKDGIEVLKKTYKGDPDIEARIALLSERIEDRLSQIRISLDVLQCATYGVSSGAGVVAGVNNNFPPVNYNEDDTMCTKSNSV
jgi:hypothetical protein